jgi:hypothetical protein
MSGGGGQDTFVFSAGTDRVSNFRAGDDEIDMTALFTDFATVMANAAQVGTSTVITLTEGTLILQNVQVGTLTDSDFLF